MCSGALLVGRVIAETFGRAGVSEMNKSVGIGIAIVVVAAACSSEGNHAASVGSETTATGGGGASGASGSGNGGSVASNGGASGTSDSGAGASAASGSGSSANAGAGSGGSSGGGSEPGLPVVPGEPDTSVQTALPPLPTMVNVRASAIDDSVGIEFDPIEGAKDYRVYVLPADGDVSSDSTGHLTIKNAVYRCAGNRQMPKMAMDAETPPSNGGMWTFVDGMDVHGYTRTLPEATLGYVYTTPGDGRVPVYAMGDPDPKGENLCGPMRFGATRCARCRCSIACSWSVVLPT